MKEQRQFANQWFLSQQTDGCGDPVLGGLSSVSFYDLVTEQGIGIVFVWRSDLITVGEQLGGLSLLNLIGTRPVTEAGSEMWILPRFPV